MNGSKSSPGPKELQAIGHLFLGQMKAKPGKPAEQRAERMLVRENDARVRPPFLDHLLVQKRKIATIVREEDAPDLGRKGKLIFVPLLDITGRLGSEDIDSASPEGGSQRHIHVFVQIETDLHRSRMRRTFSSLFASMSASISAWWS